VRNIRGLALLEVLLAITLMAMVIFLIGAYYPLASLTAQKGRDETVAAQLATQRMEQFRSRPFSWVTQANMNSQFNFVSGNANCPVGATEIIADGGSCHTSTDISKQYTRVTTVTTSYTGQARLTKVRVVVSWQESSGTDSIEFSTVLVDFP